MFRRWRDTAIYEMHVKGMTMLHDRVPEELRGTYAGLAAPAVTDYLHDLGITAVELLPIQQFFSEPALAERGLVNYWGYNSLGFFAPHNAYSHSGDRGQQVAEFKQMVKSFHEAGLEVILDVVYNHTAEAGPLGPTLSFRGLDDLGYYQRVVDDHGTAVIPDVYWDVTGCGNTVDATHTQSLRMILDSLRYWVNEMHVDGFRFDLLSALTRTNQRVDMGSHLLTAIGQDPVLRHVKLIAEPWDASMDGYKVGDFPPPWVEWNDQYRDAVRDFWRGQGDIRTVATRLAGSSDLYADDGRSPYASVNFVTAHDGFTLRDLVSYEKKHNEANGEGNRDGTDNHRSWNCGVEGETEGSGDRRAATPAGGQPDGHPLLHQRRADDHRRRRTWPHPARQQQRLRAGQRDLVDRLAARRRLARRLRDHQDRPAPAAGASGVASAALVRGAAGHPRRAEGPDVAAPRRPRDDGRGLGGHEPGRARHVRLRIAAAVPRPAWRAAGRLVVHDLDQRLGGPDRDHASREPVGALRSGGAVD